MKRGSLCWLILATFVLVACQSIAVERPKPVTITIAGSTVVRPLLQELGAAFTARHPEVLFDLRGGGSTLGEEQARAGQVTLGVSTLQPPLDDETMLPLNDGLNRSPIGLDAIAVIVHATSDVSGLSLVQLRDLYAGNVIDWLQLGDSEGEVLLVSREEGSGTRANFEANVMGEAPVSLTAVVMPTSADVVDYVAGRPQTIGYVSSAIVASSMDAAAEGAPVPIRVLPIEGALPTTQGISEQNYPLAQPLYIVSRGRPTGRARQFVDFVLSPAGQEIVAKYHIPVR